MSAAAHILRRMQHDKRLAYLLGPGSQSWDLLTQEVAAAQSRTPESLRAELEPSLQTQRVFTSADVARALEMDEQQVLDLLGG